MTTSIQINKTNLVQEFDSGGLEINGMSSFINWVVDDDNSTKHNEEDAAIFTMN